MLKAATVLAFAFALPTAAMAQDITISRDLWTQMTQAFGAISMPLPAHQQVQQVLQNVERESAMRAAREKTADKPAPDKAK